MRPACSNSWPTSCRSRPRGSTSRPVRAALRARLPAYMVPALLETLPVCPLSPAAKWTARACPLPRTRPAEARPDLVPPRTPLEKQLVASWERLFAPTQVSVQDDFFLDLGGHSLLAARMVSELRKTPPFRQLSVLDVYQHPTAEKLAAHFQSAGEGERPREPKHPAQAGLRGRSPSPPSPLLAALLLRRRPVGQPVRHPELLRPAMAGALPHLHRPDRRGIRLPDRRARCLRQPHRAAIR